MAEGCFPITAWTTVLTARDGGDTTGARTALAQLCQQYWFPLYAFARRWGLAAEDAEDATQQFFAELLRAGLFSMADPSLGKLRTFLLAAFQRDLVDFRKRETRQKRGGGFEIVSLDTTEAEVRLAAAEPVEAAAGFEHEWALSVLDAAVARLERDYAASGRATHFTALRPFLTEEGDYAALRTSLSLAPEAARQAVHRLRSRFGRALREVIADTLREPTPEAVEAEFASLRAVLTGRA